MKTHALIFAIVSLLGVNLLFAQPITFSNPGFEDLPRHSHPPKGWTSCGDPQESPPDTQPDATFQVSTEAFEGSTYLGMVTRDNDTWENVGTWLNGKLKAGEAYYFSIALARSNTYYSVSRETNTPANYTEPIVLRIWGGTWDCDRAELLVETEAVTHTEWRMYHLEFTPQEQDYDYFMLEAYYDLPVLFPYNGNLLLDAASPIYRLADLELVDAEDDNDLAKEAEVQKELSSLLSKLDINNDAPLNEAVFLLHEGGRKKLTQGHPSLFQMRRTLWSSNYRNWELVVHDDNLEQALDKIDALTEAIEHLPGLKINIRLYDDQIHSNVAWASEAPENGLFMRVAE